MRHPVETLEELDALDDGEIIEGYFDGRQNAPEPGHNRSKSFWHGWRNGMVDGHHRASDGAQMVLAKLFAERLRKERR